MTKTKQKQLLTALGLSAGGVLLYVAMNQPTQPVTGPSAGKNTVGGRPVTVDAAGKVLGLDQSLPRGLRNCGPFNLQHTTTRWWGKVGHDGRFEVFENMAFGIRAGIRNLRTQIRENGHNTLAKLIPRLSPAFENDTAKYLRQVCAATGLGPNDAIPLTNMRVIGALAGSIISTENGATHPATVAAVALVKPVLDTYGF